MYLEKALVTNKISFSEKTINALFVTCMMIKKLSNYVSCFLKQALMYKWMHFLIEDDDF